MNDPQSALIWIATVTDDRQREQFFRDHVGVLNRLVPDVAQALAAEGRFGDPDQALGELVQDGEWRRLVSEIAAAEE